MCSRFAIFSRPQDLADYFGLDPPPPIAPRFNIAPTQPVLVVRARPDAAGALRREAVWMQWGLVPSWAPAPGIGSRLINARCEEAAAKPSFRAAFKRRRCLIPASGFYEWPPRARGKSSRGGRAAGPWFFRPRGGGLFAFAGLWELWTGGGESALESCTILTTAANAAVAPVHDRMPVIVPPEHFALWLDPSVQTPDRLTPLLRPSDPGSIEAWPVSPRVNTPAVDDAECIRPADESVAGEPPPFV